MGCFLVIPLVFKFGRSFIRLVRVCLEQEEEHRFDGVVGEGVSFAFTGVQHHVPIGRPRQNYVRVRAEQARDLLRWKVRNKIIQD